MPSLLPGSGPNPQINASGNVNVNSANSPGNTYTSGNFQDPTSAVVNRGNVAYTGSPNSAAALAGKGVEQAPTVNANSPKLMSGGRRRRSSSRRSKRYSKVKRMSSKYRSRSRSKSRASSRSRRAGSKKNKRHSRKMRGGYQQYLGNRAFSFGQTFPGSELSSKMSALANPTIFKAYENCPGGK